MSEGSQVRATFPVGGAGGLGLFCQKPGILHRREDFLCATGTAPRTSLAAGKFALELYLVGLGVCLSKHSVYVDGSE